MKAENIMGLFGIFFVVAPNKNPNNFFTSTPPNIQEWCLLI